MSSQATSSRPGIGGFVARVPTLRNTSGARSDRPPTSISNARAGATGEAGLAVQQRQAVGVPERIGLSVHPAVDERVLAGHHGGEVDGDLAGAHAVSPGGPREVGHPCRRPQRLGRTASPVQARTTHLVGFDHRDPSTGGHEVVGDARAGLAGSDHDRVERAVSALGGHDPLRDGEPALRSVDRCRLNPRTRTLPPVRWRTTLARFEPPRTQGSGASVQFGTRITTAAPGSAQGLYLTVSDIEAAREAASGGIRERCRHTGRSGPATAAGHGGSRPAQPHCR